MTILDDMLDTLVLQRGDPAVAAVFGAAANELARIEQAALQVAAGLVAAQADDDLGLLSVHEAQHGLPAGPPISVADRQALLRARLLARSVGPRPDWIAAVQAAVGEDVPIEVRVDAATVEVLVPVSVTGVRREALEGVLRAITNAGVRVSLGYHDGFVVGVSQVGDVI